MLWENFLTDCITQIKSTVSDGQGGVTTSWEDGTTFTAAIVKDTSTADRIAEKQGVTASYTVTTPVTTLLKFHDIFKRKSDNKLFIVTSDYIDTKPPNCASFEFWQVSAKEWTKP
ncbi:MAG: hypothetical protein IKQ46_10575 [Bacteroidales bacterium]|nr:hypothetical protein [Bacteroidales bacterium]